MYFIWIIFIFVRKKIVLPVARHRHFPSFILIPKNWFLRASKLVHVSSPIARLMQCCIWFLMMWRRESKERERDRCLAKQPPHERNNYLMRQLHNHCMSYRCHATHNIPCLYAQIKELYKSYKSTRQLTRQLII
jgi:hypothetical protein